MPLLTAICTGTVAIGIEREPAYVACAKASARALQLTNVQFHCQDARAADLSRGALFYLFTPFVGAVLREMLEILRRLSAGRTIRIAAHGPCWRAGGRELARSGGHRRTGSHYAVSPAPLTTLRTLSAHASHSMALQFRIAQSSQLHRVQDTSAVFET